MRARARRPQDARHPARPIEKTGPPLQQPTGLMYFPECDMPSGEDQDAQSALYTRTRHLP